MSGKLVPVVAAGGVIGALARSLLDAAVPHSVGSWPWSTFVINVLGSLLLGFVLVTLALRVNETLAYWVRPFLITGILGGFTTFSAYANQVRELMSVDRLGLAAGYALASIVVAVLAVMIGALLARAVWHGVQLLNQTSLNQTSTEFVDEL